MIGVKSKPFGQMGKQYTHQPDIILRLSFLFQRDRTFILILLQYQNLYKWKVQTLKYY